jgi:hypothetical protein
LDRSHERPEDCIAIAARVVLNRLHLAAVRARLRASSFLWVFLQLTRRRGCARSERECSMEEHLPRAE